MEEMKKDFWEEEEEEIATPEEMKVEAVKRLRKMHIINDAVRQFVRDDQVMVSEPPFGGLYWLDENDEATKKEVEEKCGGLVYLVIRAFTTIGKIDSFCYVSKYKSEWEIDDEDLDEGIVMSYTLNHDMPDCSEFGSIGFRSVAGGVLRIC